MRCRAGSARVDPDIIQTVAPRRISPFVRKTASSPARSARATAVLFAFGSLMTLVDASMTSVLLRDGSMTERWAPVRALMSAIGVDLALALCSIAAVGAMAIIAWGAVRARPAVASASYFVLCAVVALRICGCVNNFGVLLT